METTKINENKVAIAVSRDELTFLCNAIGETLEALEEWEFETRTGKKQTRAMEIHAQLAKALDEMQRA